MARITIDVSEANECTRAPYWLILDPRPVSSINYLTLARMVTGPFFSRDDAETYLANNLHNFGPDAVVYCKSGYHCRQYDNACDAARIGH